MHFQSMVTNDLFRFSKELLLTRMTRENANLAKENARLKQQIRSTMNQKLELMTEIVKYSGSTTGVNTVPDKTRKTLKSIQEDFKSVHDIIQEVTDKTSELFKDLKVGLNERQKQETSLQKIKNFLPSEGDTPRKELFHKQRLDQTPKGSPAGDTAMVRSETFKVSSPQVSRLVSTEGQTTRIKRKLSFHRQDKENLMVVGQGQGRAVVQRKKWDLSFQPLREDKDHEEKGVESKKKPSFREADCSIYDFD